MEKPTQLELKYLAAYLPYGLFFRRKDMQLCGIRQSDEHQGLDEILLIDSWGGLGWYAITEFKPILKPLSACTPHELKLIIKHLFRDTQMIRPELSTIECNNGFITFFDNATMQRYTAVKPGGDNLPVLNMSNHFNDYEIFFKLHIDMYGLIDAGLAVDINTLQNG